MKNLNRTLLIIYAIFVYIAFAIFTESRSLNEVVFKNEADKIVQLYKAYIDIAKRNHTVKSILVDNENYIDDIELRNEFRASTPFLVDAYDIKNAKYSLSIEYFDKSSTDDISDRILSLNLNELSYEVSIEDYGIQLFGVVEDRGYVLISRNTYLTHKIIESVEDIFYKIMFAVFIFFLIILYFHRESMLYKKRKKELEDEYKVLQINTKALAFVDELTKADSRLKFSISINDMIETSRRFESCFVLILFDVDNFKKINDTYGHDYGDIVLKSIAKNVKEQIRKSDIFARWGGEEFVLLLPSTAQEDGVKFAEKIRKNIEEIRFEKISKVTCSFGVVSYAKGDDEESMIKRADKLLYKAKNAGRNCVKGE